MTDATAATTTARAEPAYQPSPGPPPPVQPLPLGYAPPQPSAVKFDTVLVFLWLTSLFRRVVFALRVGFLTYGLVAGFADRIYRENLEFAAWGAGLIALVLPFPAGWRHRPTRR